MNAFAVHPYPHPDIILPSHSRQIPAFLNRNLKAIGFTDRSLLFFVLAEALTIALVGGLLGLGLAAVAVPALAAALNGLLPTLILSKTILAMGLGLAVFVGGISGLLPGIGAMRMRVVNALRRI